MIVGVAILTAAQFRIEVSLIDLLAGITFKCDAFGAQIFLVTIRDDKQESRDHNYQSTE